MLCAALFTVKLVVTSVAALKSAFARLIGREDDGPGAGERDLGADDGRGTGKHAEHDRQLRAGRRHSDDEGRDAEDHGRNRLEGGDGLIGGNDVERGGDL